MGGDESFGSYAARMLLMASVMSFLSYHLGSLDFEAAAWKWHALACIFLILFIESAMMLDLLSRNRKVSQLPVDLLIRMATNLLFVNFLLMHMAWVTEVFASKLYWMACFILMLGFGVLIFLDAWHYVHSITHRVVIKTE